MTEMVLDSTGVTTTATTARARITQGLLRREWLAHRTLLWRLVQLYCLTPALVAYFPFLLAEASQSIRLFGVDVRVGGDYWNLFDDSGGYSVLLERSFGWNWTYWVGIGLALVLGLVGGGAETSAGLEEGTLGLPPTRRERYRARLRFHATILGAHVGLATLIILIHQYVLTRWDYAPTWPIWWFGGVIGTIWLVFITTFTAAANGGPGRRPMLFFMAVALPLLAVQLRGVTMGFNDVAQAFDGANVGPAILLLIVTVGALITWAGERIYCTREVHALVDPA